MIAGGRIMPSYAGAEVVRYLPFGLLLIALPPHMAPILRYL